MDKKILNLFEFFKSTLLINLSVCLVSLFFGTIDTFFFVFASYGFVITILYKEIYKKNDYLFYYNNGVSKLQLIGFSYFFTIFLSVLFLILKEIF
mgnify:CR=1 FL=1